MFKVWRITRNELKTPKMCEIYLPEIMVESHLPQKPKIATNDVKKKLKSDGTSESSTTVAPDENDKMEVDSTASKETLDALCVDDIKEHAKLIEKSMITMMAVAVGFM